ncbi:hypothetical protein WA158_007770 [Blastocystis sp. Blastoise]
MSVTDCQLSEEKYLFTFQDETQLWITREFIEKYKQFSFYDIIMHSEKYDDDSYYMDMSSFLMDKVIFFLMEEKKDISSMSLRDSYAIYRTLYDYSIVINREIQSELLFHIKELFLKYLKDNNYNICAYYDKSNKSRIPMELFSSEKAIIYIQGLFTPQRKDELFYYSFLFKMINITEVDMEYDYASNIPLEYICPSYIKDIFPSLKKFTINVISTYNKTDVLLNPNSDEYIMEYSRLFDRYGYKIKNVKTYGYYTELEMNEYNKISTLDIHKLYYSYDLVKAYNERRENSKLPKLYKYIVNETIYTNDYSKQEINRTVDEYTLTDRVIVHYDDKKDNKILDIVKESSKCGISQLLRLPSYLPISQIIIDIYKFSEYEVMFVLKSLEEGVFDSLTILSVEWIKELTDKIDHSLFMKIITTHVFPNVNKVIYEEVWIFINMEIERFKLSSIKKICFPKLHIDNYQYVIQFPLDLISIVDTIHINKMDYEYKERIAILFDDLVYTNSMHIDGIDRLFFDFPHLKELIEKDLISIDELYLDFPNIVNIKKLDYFENYKHDIQYLDIKFESYVPNDDDLNEITMKNSLERFIKSNVLQHLNELTISFDYSNDTEYLEWISSLFDNNKFNTIHKLAFNLESINEYSSSECINIFETLIQKLILKASIVSIKETYNKLDDTFFAVYTTENLPKLKSITFYSYGDKKWWNDFIQQIFEYSRNSNFPSSSTIQLTSIPIEMILF